ncbi:MAG: hypothetical protein CMN78_03555 [Spirochaetales bacterium]|nr:hypothetical protein [Spirochaetales bacterium]
MQFLSSYHDWIESLGLPPLLLLGFSTAIAFYLGSAARRLRLPSIIGFMVIGVLMGPSVFNLLSETKLTDFSVITRIALSFVALSIGLELKFSAMKSSGRAMTFIILGESLLAFAVVFVAVLLVTGDVVMSLLFGAIAPPSAPAGTVAVIQENRARGPLTNALYAVVGFDDGLGIVIFGFVSAIAMSIIGSAPLPGEASLSFLSLIGLPIVEIIASMGIGAILGLLFSVLGRKRRSSPEVLILLIACIFFCTGATLHFGFSFILANMVIGIIVVNTQASPFVQRIRDVLSPLMPFLFLLFFMLAGASLHLAALPALGLIGIVYLGARSAGKIGGATFGALVGRAEKVLRRYIGIGILSQAGVAIGLSLVVKEEFAAFGQRGADIGAAILTTITATSIVFEIIGPIFARIALKGAGEIGKG